MLIVLFALLIIALITYVFLRPLIDHLFYSVPHEPLYVHSYTPVIGFGLKLFKDPVEFIRSLYLKYGRTFVISLGSRRFVYLYDQQTYLTKVLRSPDLSIEEFTADFVMNSFGVDHQWVKNQDFLQIQTKQYHQYLSGDRLEILNKRVYDSLIYSMKYDAKEIQSNPSKVANFFDLFGEFMLYAGCNGLFGKVFTSEQRNSIPNFYQLYQGFDEAVKLGVIRAPFRTIRHRSAFDKHRIFAKRFQSFKLNTGESDLMHARDELFRSDEYKHLFPEDDIATLHAALLWVAVANTMPTSCWVIIDLFLHPEALNAVRQELKEHLPSSSSSTVPIYDKETLAKLSTLESCVNESMRRTSYVFSTRQAMKSTTIECLDKTKIGLRKSDMLVYPAFLRHTDPDLFGPHPYRYQYDRFIKRPNQTKVPSVMLFGCGAHTCPGRYWAINEIKLLVALIVQHMDIEFVNMTEHDRDTFRERLPYDYSKIVAIGGAKKGYEHKFDIKYSYKNLNMD